MEHKITLYNTLTHKKEPLEPREGNNVTIYACGPTVYSSAHLGHARSAVTFDIIRRFLKKMGYGVTYVRNFTDIDDKIINKATEAGVPAEEISEKYTREYSKDMADLGVSEPDFEPKVTEHLPEIIELISSIIDNGYGYVSGGDVFFSVKKFPGYGKLSRRSLEDMSEESSRIDLNEQKEDPLDFALWKGAKPGEPSWDSPWGPGRPGWHIECSAMSMKYLGSSFDIHGGGKDLIFPHHENEIAQSEAGTGGGFAKYWVHNGMILINREKMSKSLGNIFNIGQALKKWNKESIRLFFASHHYQNPADFSEQAMDEAEAALDRLYITIDRIDKLNKTKPGEDKTLEESLAGFKTKWVQAMCDNFNTAGALGNLFDLVKAVNRSIDTHGFTLTLDKVRKEILEFGDLMNILQEEPEQYLKSGKSSGKDLDITEDEIQRLIEERKAERREKNWAKADEVRDFLNAKGITIEDKPQGTVWRVDG
ncbi:MAG: cysteine--tRNA ligase [Candidatus Dadabacteria bacterium]|nr:cysteine--tRNA ligase [Candidatus Dadabacteria bacterium]